MNTVDHCPYCDMLNSRSESFLGQLGDRDHHVCRYCGGAWSCKASDEAKTDDGGDHEHSVRCS